MILEESKRFDYHGYLSVSSAFPTTNPSTTNTIVNSPAIKWQGGELQIKQNKSITDNTPYGGGQVLNIDTENMVVSMVSFNPHFIPVMILFKTFSLFCFSTSSLIR
jgi:hypothetical protein